MKTIFAAILALISFPAFAQGWYIGLAIGQSKVQDFCDGAPSNITCEDTDGTARIFGGYQLNPNLALELGSAYLGEFTARGPGGFVTVEASALDFVAVGLLPVSPQVSLYGKAGLYRSVTEANISTVTVRRNIEETNNGFTFGFGVSFNVTPQFSIRGEWQKYQDVGGGDIGESDVDVLSIGVMYRF